MAQESKPSKPISNFRCTFCGKGADKIKLIVTAGQSWIEPPLPQAGICTECIDLYSNILASEDRSWRDKQIERLLTIEYANDL